jgi:superfamily II DNA or RNA helicase
MECKNRKDYLARYGPLIAERARAAFQPLHVPASDAVVQLDLKRPMLPAQEHAVTAAVRALQRQKAIFLCGVCGTGKTQMGACAVQAHAAGKPYRAIVLCPPHLVQGPDGWATQLRAILPEVEVKVLRDWWELIRYPRNRPSKPTWLVLGETKAKALPFWWPAVTTDRYGILRCPDCGAQVRARADDEGAFADLSDLARTKKFCQAEVEKGRGGTRKCGAALWQWARWKDKPENWPPGPIGPAATSTRGRAIWAPAAYIHKHMRGVFDYLICDEAHQEKGDNTARANALGSLAAAVKKVIAMTGTLSAGRASNVRSLLFRLCPRTLRAEGLRWEDAQEFVHRYGQVDTIITEKQSDRIDNRRSKGRSQSRRESERPGIMPTLFGRHLIGNAIFLGLEEVFQDLPGYDERLVPVEMSDGMVWPYKKMEGDLRAAVKELLCRGSSRMLSKMLQALLAWPDYPYDWPEIGYTETGKAAGPDGRYVFVTQPPTLDRETHWTKEQKLLEILRREKAEGRQCWVFCVYTKTHPVLLRLERIIREAGFTVKVLHADRVPAQTRGDWIARNAPGVDVMISHPHPVGTGMTLFAKDGSYNFPTLIFAETGYDLTALRQASRRSFRIGQRQDCRVYFLYYEDTMQAKAMDLMGAKMDAALALEGTLKADGLAAMAADTGSGTMELARSLVGAVSFASAERVWRKIGLAERQPGGMLAGEDDMESILAILAAAAGEEEVNWLDADENGEEANMETILATLEAAAGMA